MIMSHTIKSKFFLPKSWHFPCWPNPKTVRNHWRMLWPWFHSHSFWSDRYWFGCYFQWTIRSVFPSNSPWVLFWRNTSWSHQYGTHWEKGWHFFILNECIFTSDGIGFGDSLVIGNRPGGSGHDSILDGVGLSVSQHSGEGESGTVGQRVGKLICYSLHVKNLFNYYKYQYWNKNQDLSWHIW